MIPDEVIREAVKTQAPAQQTAREMLLLCTCAELTLKKKERISRILAGPLDWDYFLHLAGQHGITPLVAYHLTTISLACAIPEDYLKQFKKIYNSNLSRNITLSGELKKILSTFRQYDIETIVLKGTMLAEYLLANPGLRTVGDMDILVPPEKVSLASSLLVEMGYQQLGAPEAWRHAFHEAPFCKMARFPLIVELHRNLDDERLIVFPSKALWRRTQLLVINDSLVRIISPEDYLIYLSNHLSKHVTHRLRLLNDISELLKKHHHNLDWKYIIKSARSWEIDITVYYAIKWAREMLDAPVPVSAIKALKPEEWRRKLIDFLFRRDFFIRGTRSPGLKDKTYTLARALMMRRLHRAAIVLTSNYRNKKAVWFRVIAWIFFVFAAALIRNFAAAENR